MGRCGRRWEIEEGVLKMRIGGVMIWRGLLLINGVWFRLGGFLGCGDLCWERGY